MPIVTSALPDLKEFSEFIGYSQSEDKFFENIKKMLKIDRDKISLIMKRLGAENSWKSRVSFLNDKLLKLLLKRY